MARREELLIFDTRDPKAHAIIGQVLKLLHELSGGREGLALAIVIACAEVLRETYDAKAGLVASDPGPEVPITPFDSKGGQS